MRKSQAEDEAWRRAMTMRLDELEAALPREDAEKAVSQ
jgi:hypothetical protein